MRCRFKDIVQVLRKSYKLVTVYMSDGQLWSGDAMNRFQYASRARNTRRLLLLGILVVVIAGSTGTDPFNNPFSNIPTLVAGVSMILLAIILSIMGKREQLE